MSVSSDALSTGASSPNASSNPSSDPSSAVSSATRGFGYTNADTCCLSCGKSVGRRGQIHMRKQMTDHFSSSEQCRPPGKLNYSALARDAELKMIANDDRFRRLGKGGCDWFERDDPADIFKCVSCDHLFDSFGKAARHHVRTSCQNGPPPAPVSCHITTSGVLVEVRPMYRRRLESSLDAAAGSTCKYCLFALILCNSILFLSPDVCIIFSPHHHTCHSKCHSANAGHSRTSSAQPIPADPRPSSPYYRCYCSYMYSSNASVERSCCCRQCSCYTYYYPRRSPDTVYTCVWPICRGRRHSQPRSSCIVAT